MYIVLKVKNKETWRWDRKKIEWCIQWRTKMKSLDKMYDPVLYIHTAPNSIQNMHKKFFKSSALSGWSDAQCSKIGKKVQFQKYKKALFAFSKMAKS